MLGCLNQSRGPESRKPTRMDRLRPDLLQLQQTPKMWRLSQEDEDLRPSFNTSASPVAVPQTTTGGRLTTFFKKRLQKCVRVLLTRRTTTMAGRGGRRDDGSNRTAAPTARRNLVRLGRVHQLLHPRLLVCGCSWTAAPTARRNLVRLGRLD
ncbi:hypothetical protein OJAV_G00174650 [Oryzias javanicus]|uniref:Uncharacterized protein n=1 Tax=Oryzias javanicus TaxID=123683 RepID=A0A3S2U337_ORYJA|nr:hypothetical protein OJAV_G00174650 [Oryzias javanicus]